MTFELVIAFNLALLAAIASPGPAFVLAIQTALSKGKWAGIKLGIGLGAMASIWTLCALVGLDGIFKVLPWTFVAMKVVGAAYLLFIAWNTWKNSSQPLKENIKAADHAIRDGFLLNLSNPKSILFAAAVLVVVFPPDLSPLEKTAIILNHFIVEVVCYSLIALLMNTKPASRAYIASKLYVERMASVVMGALGLRLLLDR